MKKNNNHLKKLPWKQFLFIKPTGCAFLVGSTGIDCKTTWSTAEILAIELKF